MANMANFVVRYMQQAEKFADSAARHITEDPRDMRISEVSAGVAQAYATLALAAVSARAEPVEAYIHDDHDSAFEKSCGACAEEPRQGRETRESVLVDIGALMSEDWDWNRLENEFIGQIGAAVEESSLRDLKEFRTHMLGVRKANQKPRRVQHALAKHEAPWIDYSDLAADGPSMTVDEAWANVANYLRQQDRALSAYVINPEVNVEIADEITPVHVLRWSSLKVLLAEREALLKAATGGAS